MIQLSYEFLRLALSISGGIFLCWLGFLCYRHLRQQKAIRQFRESLSILANTLREGHPFSSAVSVLADLGPHPLSGEFRRLQNRLDQGADFPTLRKELLQRFPCFEAKYLVAALDCYSDEPEKLSASLVRLEQLRQNRKAARKRVVSACAASRQWIRVTLLAGPVLLTTLAFLRPTAFLFFRSKLASSTANLILLTGLLVVVGWFVLILQKQDEAEIVLD